MNKIDSIVQLNNNAQKLEIKEPGFLVKTHCKQYGFKFFINVCHSTSISTPTIQLDEKDLHELISKEKYDELSKFTIPLVLERLTTTKDKKNSMAKMTNVIINSRFYQEKILSSEIYKNYLVYIIIDTVNGKFNLNLDNTSFIILKNRKYQLADSEQEFNKFIDSYNVQNIFNQNNDIETLNKIFDNECNQQDDDDYEKLNKNLIITRDFIQKNLLIKIKLENLKICLKMNDDHVIIVDALNNNKILREFYLPIRIDPTKVNATIKQSILMIECNDINE